jgi:hypothetical protein
VNTTTGAIQYTPTLNYNGLDSFTYTVNDDDGATSNAATVTISILQEHQIILNHGWNIISVPFYESIPKEDIIVYYAGSLYTWDEAVANGYILDFLYNYNRATQQYSFSNSLEPGYGYWIWANKTAGCTLLVYSNADGTGHITDLKAGWNIMGLPYRTSIAKTTTHIVYNTVTYNWDDAVTAHYILGFVYGWNSATQTYELCNTFDPTRGYWMYAYHDCTLQQ